MKNIFFFLLICRVFPKKFIIDVSSKNKVTALPDFGFEKGGSLFITLLGLNFTGVKLFVLSPILREIFYRTGNNDFFCTASVDFFIVEFHPHVERIQNENFHVSTLSNYVNDIYNNSANSMYNNIKSENDKLFFNRGIGYIAVNVTNPNIYLPIITNCNNHEKMSAIVQYINNGSFLDTREMNIQSFFTITSIIYFLFMLVWIIDGLLYPLFSIRIHYLFTFSCISKIISFYFSCLKWGEKQKVENISRTIILCEIISRCFSFMILTTTNMIASLGFGVYKSYNSIEVILTVLISMFIFITTFISEEDYMNLKIFGIVSSFICFVLLGQFVKNGIDSASSFYNIFNEFVFELNSPNFFLKINLVISFCYTFLIILFIYVLAFYISLFNDSKMMRIIVKECSEILFFIVDLIFFTYRRSYEPVNENNREMRIFRRIAANNRHLVNLDNIDDLSDPLENRSNENQNNISTKNCKIVEIEDPNRKEISLLL